MVDVYAGPRGVGAIQPLDPGRGVAQHFRALAYHQDGVETGDRLEFDHILAETVFAGIDDLLQLLDDWRRRAARDRENADRLTAHPIDVEAQRGVDRGTALGAGAL